MVVVDVAIMVTPVIVIILLAVVLVAVVFWNGNTSRDTCESCLGIVLSVLLVTPLSVHGAAMPSMATLHPGSSMPSVPIAVVLLIHNLSPDAVPCRRLVLVLFIFPAPQQGHTPSAEVVPTADRDRVLEVILADGAHGFITQ